MKYLSIFIFILASFFSLGYAMTVIFGGEHPFHLFLPDDAYYYLQVAREYANSGAHSFDKGVSYNTGYHLLWFYMLSFFASIVNDSNLILTSIIIGIIISWVSVCLSFSTYYKKPHLLMIVSLFITSYAFINGQISVMEWPLCVLISSLLFMHFSKASKKEEFSVAYILILGCLGSLARTDFGGVAACFLVSAVLISILKKDNKFIKPSFFLFLGAILGFVLVSVHNYSITGDWLSSSAITKANWAKLSHPNPVPALYQFGRSILYLPILVAKKTFDYRQTLIDNTIPILIIFTIGIITGSLVFRKRITNYCLELIRSNDSSGVFVIFASFLVIAGYTALYSINSDSIRYWYSAHLVVPILIILFFLMDQLFELKSRIIKFTVTGILTGLVLVNIYLGSLSYPNYSFQSYFYATALTLQEARNDGRILGKVGVPDAGVIGYVTNGMIVNTDGLVNHSIAKYNYAKLPCYLVENKIRYVMNFGHVIESSGKPIPWKKISKPVLFKSSSGYNVILNLMNFDSVNQVYGCKLPSKK